MAETASAEPLAVYIHWPFCLSKCPYCDFNSHVRENIDVDRWRAGLLAEIDHYATETTGRRVSSIFFGGGTPSLMPPDLAGDLIERINTLWGLGPDCEVILEANPTSAEAANFHALAQAGVNRLSVGVQALNDPDLAFLGRQHSHREALAAIDAAQSAVDRVSFDLIYARPGQTAQTWEEELKTALSIGTEHLSLYQLTIERGTSFFAAYRGGHFSLPDEDLAAALFDLTNDICAGHGLPAYEISNHARPGAESRHNLTYWRGGDYAGIGPGAHGRLTIDDVCYATEQITGPENWLAAVEQDGHGTRRREALTRDIRIEEIIMTGLRLAQGLERRRFEALAGCELEQVFEARTLRPLLAHGLLTLDEAGLRATGEGRLKLNAVLAALLG